MMKTAITIPPLGESVDKATIIEWMKKEGDAIHQDDMLLTLETDKVTLEVYAPADGVLAAIACAADAVVESGAVVGFIESDEKAKGSAKTRMAPQLASLPQEKVPSLPQKKKKDEPKKEPTPVKAKEDDNNDDDMDWLLKSGNERGEKSVAASRHQHTEPVTPLRRRIAARLKQAQREAAILTTFNEVDMSAAQDLRRRYGEAFLRKYGVKLGYMGFFVRAAAEALQRYPMVNAYFSDEGITHHDYCDIGIAISVPQGLVVPVVRDAQHLTIADVEKAIVAYAEEAKEGRLKPDALRGGTFTITNGGVFGSMLSTPILNPPQSAILGMHSITERAVVVAGALAVRPMMYVALSYDHRILDGKDAVLFLNHIKDSIEAPGRLLLGV